MLALSHGGGSAGEREMPMLVDGADWSAAAANARRLAGSGDDSEVARLLGVLNGALTRCAAGGALQVPSQQLCELAGGALAACHERWSTRGPVTVQTTVDLYAKVSQWVMPLPPMPPLDAIWQQHCQALEDADPEYDPSGAMEAVSNWLDLVALIAANEPRFLRQFPLPSGYEGPVQSTLSAALDDAQHVPECDSESELDDEISRIGDWSETAEAAAATIPSLADLAGNLCDALDSLRDGIEGQREDVQQRQPEPDWPEDETGSQNAPSVESIFADL
jgi:hypothetical protein